MRGYCDFYEVAPSDEALLALSRGAARRSRARGHPVDRPGRRRPRGRLRHRLLDVVDAERGAVGVMNDLFVADAGRAARRRRALIAACRERARARGAASWAGRPRRTTPGPGRVRPRRRPAVGVAGLRDLAHEGHQARREPTRNPAASSAAPRSRAQTDRHRHLHGGLPGAARRPLAAALPRQLRVGASTCSARLVSWGDRLEQSVRRPATCCWVPPHETHVAREPLRERGGRVRRGPRLADRGRGRGALG